MKKYSTFQLIAVSLFILFLISGFLSDKGPVFKNIVVISLAGMLFIAGRNRLLSNSSDTKGYGRALILISITIVCSRFAKASNTARILALICCFTAIAISVYIWSKNASKKPLTCTLWLLFFPPIVSMLILALIEEITVLPTIYFIIVFCILYFSFWILMAKHGQFETTRKAIIYSGITSAIILMILTFTVDIFAPILTQMSQFSNEFSNPLVSLGYNFRDMLNICVKLITFPSIILSGISYIIILNRLNVHKVS